jgi:chorismate mutase
MSTAVRAVRGATTIDVDDESHMVERVGELLATIMQRNGLHHDDLISILFTATDDIRSAFPALAARHNGFGDIPLICARELDINGATPFCVRVMLHVNTPLARDEVRHVYLEGARGLRDDLPE